MFVVWLVVAYLAFVWVGLRLVVPNLGFSKTALPASLPPALADEVRRMSGTAASDEEYLHAVHRFVTERYVGSRVRTVTNFWRAFVDPLKASPGFLPCTGQNYLVRALLVASGRFRDEDIEIHTVPLNLFIHQYVRVRLGERRVDVDPWSAFLNVPLGGHSAYFG